MMLRFMNWHEAAQSIENALSATFEANEMTFDLEKYSHSAIILSCSEFAKKIIERIEQS